MMTAKEIATFAARESIRMTKRFGLNEEGFERASLIGRDGQREAGGREAILQAMRELGAASELTTNYEMNEFWGRLDVGDGEPGGAAYRVVVV